MRHARQQTFDAARAAFNSLETHEIAATPANYNTWFAHHSGLDPELSAALQALEDKGRVTEDALHDLQRRYAVPEQTGEAILTSSNQLEAILARLSAETDVARQEAKTYKAFLGDFGEALNDVAPEVLMRRLLALQERTEQHGHRLTKLEAELANSDDEINSLRLALKEARREAETDALTGVANRRLFDVRLQELIDESQAGGGSLSLLLLDIDHFKAFNDTHGHKAGDLVLRLVAAKLRDMVKGSDLVARYGGEEFAILLPQTMLENAKKLAENLRVGIARNQIVLKRTGRSLGTVTLSIGVAQHRSDEGGDTLVERADVHLYAAKTAGRNRVMG